MKKRHNYLFALTAAFVAGATPTLADCGFCAREVTLSKPLAKCYLERFSSEFDRVQADGIEVHLVELGACGADRGGTPMPQPTLQSDRTQEADVDESFLIPVAAMKCLADALQQADLESPGVISVEVRSEC
jgi:hypothetical protein